MVGGLIAGVLLTVALAVIMLSIIGWRWFVSSSTLSFLCIFLWVYAISEKSTSKMAQIPSWKPFFLIYMPPLAKVNYPAHCGLQ